MTMERTGDWAFAKWRKQVDAELLLLCGMEGDDLPDWAYADAFADGVRPKTAAKCVIRAAGYDE